MTCQYVSVQLCACSHGVTLWEQHPCEINIWLSQVSRDVTTRPVSDEQAAAACHSCLFVWVKLIRRRVGFFSRFFLLEYGKLVGWKPSTEQWVTTMRWISQPGCAFLARQRNPVHSTHTDTLNTVYGSLAGALFACVHLENKTKQGHKWRSLSRSGITKCCKAEVMVYIQGAVTICWIIGYVTV